MGELNKKRKGMREQVGMGEWKDRRRKEEGKGREKEDGEREKMEMDKLGIYRRIDLSGGGKKEVWAKRWKSKKGKDEEKNKSCEIKGIGNGGGGEECGRI